MIYLKLTLKVIQDYQEILIAELQELDFEGFEQFDEKIEAYIPKKRFDDTAREYIEQLLSGYPGDNYVVTEEIPEQNWNRNWERSIQPQQIGQFFVKPTWSRLKSKEGQILLEIDPKMSFGTGYHSTTRLMLEQISRMDLTGKSIIDAGTGTGILAIAAAKKQADTVFAFDIDPWSRENAFENSRNNSVQTIVSIHLGGFEVIPENKRFDLILANINRNVITAHLPVMRKCLKPEGELLITGILKEDVPSIRKKASVYSLYVTDVKTLQEWALIKLVARQG